MQTDDFIVLVCRLWCIIWGLNMNKKSKYKSKLSVSQVDNLKKYLRFDGTEEANVARNIWDQSKDSFGLILRLNAGGKMTFAVHGRIARSNKNPQFYSIGDARLLTYHRAKDFAREFREWMSLGKNPVEEYKRQTECITVEDIYRKYCSSKHNRVKPETYKTYKYHFNKLSKKFVNLEAKRVTHKNIVDEHESLTSSSSGKLADAIFNKSVRAWFEHAIHMYTDSETNEPIIKLNPVKILKVAGKYNVNNGRTIRKQECIDTEELPNLFNALDELSDINAEKTYGKKQFMSSYVASSFFKLLLFTGWRPQDAISIEWSQVADDCSDITWDDRQAAAKLKNADEFYRFPLNSEAKNVLLNLREKNFGGKWVFPAVNTEIHFKQNPSIYIKKLRKLMNVDKGYTAGIYRKTFQSYASHLNVSPSTIRRLVFHTQSGHDVQSNYIKETRESLNSFSQKVCDYILKNAGRLKPSSNIDIVNDQGISNKNIEKLKKNANKKGITLDEYLTQITSLL